VINTNVQFEIFWALTNIFMYDNLQNFIDVSRYLHICRKHYFATNYQDITELIIWSLSHVADSSVMCRDLVLNSDILRDIIELSKNGTCTLDIIRCYIWLFSKLFIAGCDRPSEEFMKEIFDILNNHLYIKDNETIINTISAMNSIIDCEYDGIIETILDSGAVVKVLSFQATFNLMRKPIVTFIGLMLTGDKKSIKVRLYF
jgi:hypothetical protein